MHQIKLDKVRASLCLYDVNRIEQCTATLSMLGYELSTRVYVQSQFFFTPVSLRCVISRHCVLCLQMHGSFTYWFRNRLVIIRLSGTAAIGVIRKLFILSVRTWSGNYSTFLHEGFLPIYEKHAATHTKHPPVRTIVHLERWEFRRSLPFSNIFSLRNGFERLHCLHSLCSFVSLETLVHPIQSKANQIFPTSTHISE